MITLAAPARVSFVTLGVADLARSTAFYQALGWSLSSSSVPGEVSFFGTAGAILALYGHQALAGDAGMEPGELPEYRGVAVAMNCDGRAQVDATLAAAVAAGGTLRTPAGPTTWGGYVGHFTDLDGHLWEVADNPGMPIGPDGRPTLP
ncbi:MAG TPA: VOC family protein [Cryptosporangiaceae bacterium]|nr:VOC family protein [Cryptosporangiaceae bacterium]